MKFLDAVGRVAGTVAVPAFCYDQQYRDQCGCQTGDEVAGVEDFGRGHFIKF